MKSQKLLIAGVLASSLVALPSVAQNQEIDRELYQLCSQFPLNSRCAGIKIPIPLDARKGEEAVCNFHTGKKPKTEKCKIATTDRSLTIYIEEGKEIEFLNDSRATVEINVPSRVLGRSYSKNSMTLSRIESRKVSMLTSEMTKTLTCGDLDTIRRYQ